jgi:hypothetical protein
MYDLSFIENQTSLSGAAVGVNELAGGWVFGGIMIVLFIVMIIAFYGRVSMSRIIAGLGFIFSILSLLLVKADLLPEWILGITISFMIIGLLILFMEKKD